MTVLYRPHFHDFIYFLCYNEKKEDIRLNQNQIEEKYILQSVDNALSIIDLLCSHEELGATEIAKYMNLGKSTVFRLLSTLLAKGFITKDKNSQYSLSYKFAAIGKIVSSRSTLVNQIHPYLTKLTELTGETSHLVIWHSDTKIIFIDKVIGTSSIHMDSIIGFTRLAHMTGSGKVLLAYAEESVVQNYLDQATFACQTPNTISTRTELLTKLEEIRKQGYACDDEESEIGLTCFAAPIFQLEKVMAAISISGPTTRMNANKDTFVETIKTLTRKISSQL